MAVGIGLLPALVRGADARACLARGDRAGAAAELRQAEKALDSCIRGEADGNAVSEASPSLRAG